MFASVVTGGKRNYQIGNSLRLRASASAYLNRTLTTPSSIYKWSFSCWVKLGALGTDRYLLEGFDSTSNRSAITFSTGDVIGAYFITGGSVVYQTIWNGVRRDPAAWAHLLFVQDTTLDETSEANRRMKLYVNGVQQTSSTNTALPLNSGGHYINGARAHAIGRYNGAGAYFDGYLADVYFVDGQALTPASFGQADTNGQWIPTKYTGTYGTNGFYLPFNDGSSTTNLCLDRSGNGNNWTPNAISLTAGATYDWMTDTPTNNYATWSPVDNLYSSNTLSFGNLRASTPVNANYAPVKSTFGMSTGKWYWECVDASGTGASAAQFGIVQTINANDYLGNQALSVCYTASSGGVGRNTVLFTTVATFNQSDVIGFAFDADALTLAIYKNNSLLTTVTGITAGTWFAAAGDNTSVGGGYLLDVNFGQRPFTYTPPTGFKALCTQNLPAPAITNPKKHFDVVPYTGNGGTKTITGMQFQPDLVWVKDRTTAVTSHCLTDAMRGTSAILQTDTTAAELSRAANTRITSFNSDGFSLLHVTATDMNANLDNYVAWNWKANGAGVTNNQGSIQSTVSANIAAGFSIVTYTGNGTTNASVGHGLPRAPGFYVTKSRGTEVTGANSWVAYHSSFAKNDYMLLDQTAAKANSTNYLPNLPDASRFYIGGNAGTTAFVHNELNHTYVAYCWMEVPGFSKIGTYVGNGVADGPFIYTGFRPRMVIIKGISGTPAATNWHIADTARDTYNVAGTMLFPNTSGTETAITLDFLSNGFKIRDAGGQATNYTSASYLFIAFAETPFGGYNSTASNAR